MNQSTSTARPRRPLAVWIAAGGDIVLATFVLAWSFRGIELGFPAVQVAFWALLGIGITVSALLAGMGSRYGSYATLALITVYLVLLLAGSVQAISWAQNWSTNEMYMWRAGAYAAFAVIWLVANYWLLLGKRARAFYY